MNVFFLPLFAAIGYRKQKIIVWSQGSPDMPMEKNFDATSAESAIFKKWESAGAFRAGANK